MPLHSLTLRTTLVTGSWRRSRRMIKLTPSLSWSLPTGFNTPLTYYYLGFFIVLLVHRQIRDDEACRKKYGKDWDKVSRMARAEADGQYCELVPWRIIPYIVGESC